MEPRFFKRGNDLFKAGVINLETASMEPRFFKRGNGRTGQVLSAQHRLQWNHAFSNVEMFVPRTVEDLAALASMEPRFFKRGNLRTFHCRQSGE